MNLLRKILLLLVVTFSVAGNAFAQSMDLVVTTSFDVVDPTDGALSLREALSNIQCDTVRVSFELPAGMCDTMRLDGASLPNTTAFVQIDGSNRGPDGGSITIDGNGHLALIVNPGASMRLANLSFVGCHNYAQGTATRGGAIYCLGNLSATQCRFVGNASANGGALAVMNTLGMPTNTVALSHCTFEDNMASYGAAIYCNSAKLTLEACHFVSNEAEDKGGAIWLSECEIEAVDCQWSSSAAEEGGAIFLEGNARMNGDNCAFADNVSRGSGGAIAMRQISAGDTNAIALQNCSFYANVCQGDGGAIFIPDCHYRLFADNCSFVRNIAQAHPDSATATGRGGAIASTCAETVAPQHIGALLNSTFAENQSAGHGSAIYFNRFVGMANCVMLENRADSGIYQYYVPSPYMNGRYKTVCRHSAMCDAWQVVDTMGVRCWGDGAFFEADDEDRPLLMQRTVRGVTHRFLRPRKNIADTIWGCVAGSAMVDGFPVGGWQDGSGAWHPFVFSPATLLFVADSLDLAGNPRYGNEGLLPWCQGAMCYPGEVTDTLRISACDSFLWNRTAQTFYADTVATDSSLAASDTLHVMVLTMNQSSSSDTTIFSGLPVLWHDSLYAVSAQATFTGVNSAGCDSVERMVFYLGIAGIWDSSAAACDSLLWRGRWFFAPQASYDTVVTDTVATASGLDSLYVLRLTLRKSSSTTLNDRTCDHYIWNGMFFDKDTVATLRYLNYLGCDSLSTLVLRRIPPDTTYDTLTATDSCLFGGWSFYTDTTLVFDTVNQFGCDSTAWVTIRLRYTPVFVDSTVQACGSFVWHGTSYESSAELRDTLPGSGGPDTIMRLLLSLGHNDTTTKEVTACDAYTWPLDGVTYLRDTVGPMAHRPSEGLCDSVVVLDLTIVHGYEDVITPAVCDSFYWAAADRWYYQSARDTLKLLTASGCDSLMELNLTLHYSASGLDRHTVCDAYTWPLNGVTYYATTDQPYAHTATSAGCDSLVFLQLTVMYSSTTLFDDSICMGESYSFNNQTYTHSGTYGMVLSNSVGCDSSVTLFLTVLTAPELVVDRVYSCTTGENILSTPNVMPYLRWSASPDDYGLNGQEHLPQIVVTPAVPTVYTLLADYSDHAKCPVTKEVAVDPVVVPEAQFSFKPTVLTLDNHTLYALDNSSGNSHGRSWFVNGVYYSSHPSLWYNADYETDSLEVMLVAFSSTCNDTAIALIPYAKVNLSVPNAFTPTGPTNNTFRAQGTGIVDFEMQIFSRSGILVFSSTDIDEAWNGTYKGKLCPEGSYVYIITYTDVTQPHQPVQRKGQVLIIH